MLALTLAVAACGGGGKANGVASLSGANKPTATTTAKPWSKQDAMQAALAFARCMRQHGIDMPDPQITADGIDQQSPPGMRRDDPRLTAAEQACAQPSKGGK
jgi:hypothetical protein